MSPSSPGSSGDWRTGLRESSPYLTLGIQLAGAVLVYVGIGYLIDRWLNTSPWFLVGGAVVGMVAFFVQLVRVVKQMNRASARRPAGKYKELDDKAWERDPWKDNDPWKEEGERK